MSEDDEEKYRKAMAVIRWLTAYRKAAQSARMLLDYDLRDLPEKACDQRIWAANMDAYKALSSVPCRVSLERRTPTHNVQEVPSPASGSGSTQTRG